MQLANRRWQRGDQDQRFRQRGGREALEAKGTGRARSGSIRSPIWVGGGTVFGRRRAIIPTACRARAPRSFCFGFKYKNRDGQIIVVDKLDLDEAKTKLMVQALAELKVSSALIVF
jgi:large subunit ribosomal protein L4